MAKKPRPADNPLLIPAIAAPAAQPSDAPAKAGRPRKAAPRARADFHRQTVLFQWALGQLGVRDLKELCERFQMGPDSGEGLDPQTGFHRFFEAIAKALSTVTDGSVTPVDRLRGYEQNILEHTQAINQARQRHNQPRVDWKYHQYLALLLTELYLDRYFEDPAALRAELNTFITAHNAAAQDADRVGLISVEPTKDDDADPRQQMALLAFWCATGSGKTLLMHMHILQYRWYHRRAAASGWPTLDQVVLITPNDGLSEQHAREFAYSGIPAISVGEAGVDGLFAADARRAIKILSIHKLQDDHGKATVATEAFEGCNLILVDEGHRGAGRGEDGKWMSRREHLARGGFCIEYSATFKEAIGTDEDLRDRYAHAVLFDYAYRSFYRDGYGKDFTILNLENDDKQEHYLTAALLLFYQQLRVWTDGGAAMKPFQIDKPLWVFVGHTVTGGKATSADDKESVSDVVEVLLFINRFLSDPSRAKATIKALLEDGFKDQSGRDLLASRLPHLDVRGDKAALAADLFTGILRDVFHATEGARLAVQLVSAATGELALKAGDSEPFGVVNVGDPAAVAAACAENEITRLEDDSVRSSLFTGINRDDSPVNLLVGARKFTEGWNSWRVSSLGLMRMGKSEGTQIIQLFGRGVRLRGYGMSLRRSSVLSNKPQPPRNLRLVETLHVFGVKASYMSQFRDWISSEVPEAQDRQVWDLPVVRNLPDRKLRTLQLRETIEGEKVERGQAFRRLGPLVMLRPPDATASRDAWLRTHRTRLNWLPRIRGISGTEKTITADIADAGDLPVQSLKKSVPLFMFDLDELVFGLERFKATRGLDRLHVDRAAVRSLLERDDWYTLHATNDDMRLDRAENRAQWHRIALQLLSAYGERLYRHERGRWEAPYIEIAEIADGDPNLITSYTIETTELARSVEDIESIGQFIADLKNTLADKPLSPWSQMGGRWRTVPFAGHLYQPLLFVGNNAMIRISPVSLNQSEATFVEDLAKWCTANGGTEVYLLRNQAVTGLGFFQAANFFPDFLLWVQQGDAQHLAFVDPKGLHHLAVTDPKIQFATTDLPRLQHTIDAARTTLILHSFILSSTPLASIGWSVDGRNPMTREQIEQLGVLFQADDPVGYIGRMMGAILAANAPVAQG